MPLKYRFASKAEIPSEHAALYVEREGAFVLDCDGVVEKGRLDEFRNNNVTLQKKLDDLTKRYEGIDPDEVRKLNDEKRKAEEALALKNGEIEKVVTARLNAATAELTKRLDALATERESLSGRLTELQITDRVIAAATKLGLRPTAHADVKLRARTALKLENGEPRVLGDDGRTVRPGRDGVTPMTLDEWVSDLASNAPHLFEANAGGGAAGNGSGGAGGNGENPFKKESWNLTKQGELVRKDPTRAKALAASAGMNLQLA